MKNFLAPPKPEVIEALSRALDAVNRVCPVPGGHKKDQPMAVRDLSRLLTQERSEIKARSYWATPRNTSAYIHYFLPWNLYRLSWLLPGLDLPLEADDMVVDLGSGPLTMVLALYCSRPDLHSRPLDFVCVDTAKQPMELGRAILTTLAGGKNFPWRVHLIKAHLFEGIKKLRGEAKMFTAANMLNELPMQQDSAIENRMAALMGAMAPKLSREGRVLVVEPGTRLGGKLVVHARNAALHEGFSIEGPCPHGGPCPMLEQRRYNPRGPDYSGWCHFSFPADKAPVKLAELTARARLDKDSLSLSALYLSAPAENSRQDELAFEDDEWDMFYDDMVDDISPYDEQPEGEELPTPPPRHKPEKPYVPQSLGKFADLRVVSEGIRLPGEREEARYVCSARGLGLLLGASRVPSGGGLTVSWPVRDGRDRKSGALLFQRTAGQTKLK